MSWFLYALGLELSRRFRRWRGAARVLLAGLLSAVLLLIPAGASESAVQVGMVLRSQEGESFRALFQEKGSALIEVTVTDEATLERNILTGKWDCGIVVPEDFGENLRQMDTEGILILRIGPGSTVYPMVRESAAACLMELLTEPIAAEYLQEIGVSEEFLEPKLAELAESTQRVQIRLQTQNGQPMDAFALAKEGSGRGILGICGILLLMLGLYLSVDLGKWLSADQTLRLRSVRRDTALLLPRLLAELLPVLLWGVILLPVLYGGFRAAAAWLAMGVCAGGIALVGSRVPPLRQAFPVLIPFLAVGCLIFEPVLLDISLLFPACEKWTAMLPLGLFLRSCDGEAMSLLRLLAEGSILLAASLLLDRKGKT